MSNVVNFPPRDGNDWPSMRHALGIALNKDPDLSDHLREHVLDRMATIYHQFPFPNDIEVYTYEGSPQVIQETIEKFLDDFQSHIVDLMVSRLMVEIELAKAQGIE